ncbi:Acetylornithine deacetylase/Succinyl-diaminopimelate desuccinylase [Algoriphagus faecimaris]|uniref:Acetylornithine deacetylase/Succinyl-diaminopimelate desuccinylase n=1 Tax=Algoriphagus faecimaris TaxID=686796 RepID=A0A1G6UNR9_9BACT|nr:M20/M25/M40 family metallo-hydrolase [Algoriphagus faecimaris]SDD42992.1 Acetylornithine deacetylase/Succinyl-diaminopimelate desuccinylase [Algoriphagus faecimaris]
MKKLAAIVFFLTLVKVQGQNLPIQQLDEMTERHWQLGLSLLQEIVAIPNDAAKAEQIEPNIQWTENQFTQRGWQTMRLKTEGVPLLLVQKEQQGAEKTVLFYFHMDGQAIDSSKWDQANPYQGVLKKQNGNGSWDSLPLSLLHKEYDSEWRIFARSTSDDKGPVAMFLTGWDAISEAGLSPNYSIKIIFDFEEEQGSPNLPAAVIKHQKDLKADLMLIMDGPRHISNEPTLTYGARGISEMTLTTYGPRVPQHSGHYGNYAPNPALMLSQLLASMKDENGRVSIPGFYDGINLSEEEMAILNAVPDDETTIKRKIGIARTDQVGNSYQESIQYPSLNIRGMSSAWVGPEARTIVPATAVAELDMRLVPESDPIRLFELIETHIKNQGFYIIDREPTEEERQIHPKILSMKKSISYQAFRTPMDSEAGAWLRKAMKRAFEKEPVQIRISGGSIPISPFVDALGIPAVTIPTVNADNNQHSPNENIRLGNYKEGIKTIISVLTEPLN